MMATVEVNTAGPEEDQKQGILSSSIVALPDIGNENSAPLNFSELTPSQFGISVQSFTPASLSNCKDKSRLAQIKARRRSSIGVRGSPETNSLIRFMAQQRMKTPPALKTPELVKNSPFLPRVASTLKQKMASFQNLMDVEENEGRDSTPKQDGNTGGCIKTRDYLSDGDMRDGEKENHPPMMTPSKRRRLGPLESCEVEIREASAPILHFSLKEYEEEENPEPHIGTEKPLMGKRIAVEEEALCAPHVNPKTQAVSPSKTQQDGVFELQSPRHPPPDDSAAASSAQPASFLHISSLPSLLEMKPTAVAESSGKSTIKKKKRVRFGGPLSPEFFDKNLPPSTPLQKGGTPARAQTPGGGLQLRSLLKTPQGSESQRQKAQLDFTSPTDFGASPKLAIPHNRRTPTVRQDDDEEEAKTIFLSMDEIDPAVIGDTECSWEVKPLNLDTAFHEECSQILTEFEAEPCAVSQLDVLDEPSSLPEEKQLRTDVEDVEPKSRKGKEPEPMSESTSEAPTRSGSRKRKQPDESEPVKRSTRTAAKSASGKMKMSSASARRWNKGVDRSLYGSRAYASKNPTLSPITERLSFISQSPALQTLTTAQSYETNGKPDMMDDTGAGSDHTVSNTFEPPSEESLIPPDCSKVNTTGRGRRLSGPKAKGRGRRRGSVTAAEETLLTKEMPHETEDQTEGHCEDQTTTNNTTEFNSLNAMDTTRTAGNPDSECQPATEEPSTAISPLAEITQRKYKRGRRSSLYRPVMEENQAEQHQMSRDVQDTPLEDQTVTQMEHSKSCSDSQGEEGPAKQDLAPWQADFNFEDVFKPVAPRGQRSVRRSLRNQNTDNSAGLAWLPWTSPESSKGSRRRTKGRRLSAALPVQSEDCEEETTGGVV